MAIALLAAAPAIGSHLGVLADRPGAARETGALWGRSRCDACGAALAARDVVPILSWVACSGRARCCGARIPARHLRIELAALGATAWAVWVVGDRPAILLASVALGWTLLGLSAIDLKRLRLPDEGTLPLILCGLALALVGLTGPPWVHALGAAIGYGALAGLAWAYRRLRGVHGLGLGDAKLLAAAGAWVGAAALPSVMLIACAAGLTGAALLGLRRRRLRWRTAIPFGPALALGFWIVWLHGPLALAASASPPSNPGSTERHQSVAEPDYTEVSAG